jgi:hypothetical protein
VQATLGCLVKHQDDVERLRGGLARDLLEGGELLEGAGA